MRIMCYSDNWQLTIFDHCHHWLMPSVNIAVICQNVSLLTRFIFDQRHWSSSFFTKSVYAFIDKYHSKSLKPLLTSVTIGRKLPVLSMIIFDRRLLWQIQLNLYILLVCPLICLSVRRLIRQLKRSSIHSQSCTVDPRSKASAYKALPAYKAFTTNP